MKRYLLHITPLSPIHIGTGEELPPFNYIIKNINRQREDYRFIRFDDIRLIKLFNEEMKSEFLRIAQYDDLVKLRQFFINVANKILEKDPTCIMSLSDVTDDIRNIWNELQNHPQNSFIVRPTIATRRSGKALIPYIPGSSLKGALRTAIMDSLDDSIRKEQKITPQADPFRAIAISDAYFDGKGTRLVGSACLYNRKTQSVANLEIFYEVIKGQAISENPPTAISMLSMNNELPKRIKFEWQMPDLPEIARRCNTFYLNLLDEEYHTYYENTQNNAVYNGFKVVDDLISEAHELENGFVVRLGLHSQFEYMTFNGLRRCENRTYSKASRTLFKYRNMYLPMGWVHIQYEPVTIS